MSPVEEAQPHAPPSGTERTGLHPSSDPVPTGGSLGFLGFQVCEVDHVPSKVPSIYQLEEQCSAREFHRGDVMGAGYKDVGRAEKPVPD